MFVRSIVYPLLQLCNNTYELSDGRTVLKRVNDVSLAINLDANGISKEVADELEKVATSSDSDGALTSSDVSSVENLNDVIDDLKTRFVQQPCDRLRVANLLSDYISNRLSSIKQEEERAQLRERYNSLFTDV